MLRASLAALLSALLSAAPSSAGSISLNPVSDAYLDIDSLLGTSLISTSALQVQLNSFGGRTIDDRFGAEFNVSGLAGKVINSAVISFATAGMGANPPSSIDIYLYGYTGDGTVTQSDLSGTFSNPLAGPFSASWISSPIVPTLTADITAFIQQQVNASSSYVGIRGAASNLSGTVIDLILGSTDYSVPPVLAINYSDPVSPTPEPSSLVLLGLGAVGVTGYARRKRKQAVLAEVV